MPKVNELREMVKKIEEQEKFSASLVAFEEDDEEEQDEEAE